MFSALPQPLSDLLETRGKILRGQTRPEAEMEVCIGVAQSSSCEHVFLKTMFPEASQAAANPLRRSAPLCGLAVSVKDLFDIEGQVTTAGSTVLAPSPAAQYDCVAVRRLRAAGGVIVGRSNMVEFAFSGVGINPHFGTPANPASRDEARIPGGSSSGAVVSVATGAAFIGLGSDTGGSIRIPAALNGIVGFKSTASSVPASGAVPLSTTLDTVCALTRSVRDAITAHEVLAARTVIRSTAPLSAYRLAIAGTLMQDALDTTVACAWERTIDRLRPHGATIETIALAELAELPFINASGGFSAAESYAWHRRLLEQHGTAYDPRVAIRILRGASMSASDYIDLIRARNHWIAQVKKRLQPFDAVLSPTVPIVAPLIADLAPGAERDGAFFEVNGRLLRNTSVVNMLDGCGLSLPCHQPGELPVGLMVWHGAMRDDTVLNISLEIERLLRSFLNPEISET